MISFFSRLKHVMGFHSRWEQRMDARYTSQIVVGQDGFDITREKPPLNLRIDLDQIASLAVYKMDMWTTDLICCAVGLVDGTELVLHEESPGFDAVMALFEGMPGVSPDWRRVVVQPAFVENYTVIYRRPETPSA